MHIALTVSDPEVWHPFYPFSGNLVWVILFFGALILHVTGEEGKVPALKLLGATGVGILVMSIAALMGNDFWGISFWFWVGLVIGGFIFGAVPAMIFDVEMLLDDLKQEKEMERKSLPAEHG